MLPNQEFHLKVDNLLKQLHVLYAEKGIRIIDVTISVTEMFPDCLSGDIPNMESCGFSTN